MHSFIPPQRFFPYLSWTEIEQMPDKANVVILQPLGAIEQHGPHLPLIVDAAISTAVVGKALAQLEPELPAYALPPLYYGKSNEHWHFPGTITLSAQTLMATLIEVGQSLYRAGFRKFALVNGHGGQPQVLEIVARDLHQQQSDFMVFPLFVWRVSNVAAELLTPKELELGIHAGDAETSLMLALLPEQVKMEAAITEYPPLPQRPISRENNLPHPISMEDSLPDSLLSMEGNLPFAWVTQDLSQSGVLGDPTVATVAKGEQILASLVTSWAAVIRDIYRFQQPTTSGRNWARS
jgi:creatinine amidohydrolase